MFKISSADTFAILGPPPCHYDIRAMGSIAREEATPFSDLELMILVEKEEVRPYFKQLVKILNLQIISLGETASPKLTFTCLHAKNSSGFHIDFNVNPDQDPDLMGTPEQVKQTPKKPCRARNSCTNGSHIPVSS
ncbi:MAG: DUF294 nucleotidyltransferase-like domain-containing protein [Rhabdochlamydiaceae bacterium]